MSVGFSEETRKLLARDLRASLTVYDTENPLSN